MTCRIMLPSEVCPRKVTALQGVGRDTQLGDCRSRVTLYCSVTVDGVHNGARGGEGALAPSCRVPQRHSCHDQPKGRFPIVLLYSTQLENNANCVLLRIHSPPTHPLLQRQDVHTRDLLMNFLVSCDDLRLVATLRFAQVPTYRR